MKLRGNYGLSLSNTLSNSFLSAAENAAQEKPWTDFPGHEMHERKVTQNLSNATTKIQLNSIPEEKTSKRETFRVFPIWQTTTRKATPTREKRCEIILSTFLRFRPLQEILFSYCCMLLFSLSFHNFSVSLHFSHCLVVWGGRRGNIDASSNEARGIHIGKGKVT